MEGDVLERLQIRRYDYYRAAMDFIDARAEHAAAQRLLVSYGAVDCVAQNKTASVSSPSVEPKSPTLGVYVWQGVELQQLDKKNNAFSAKLAQAGVARVLMSLMQDSSPPSRMHPRANR